MKVRTIAVLVKKELFLMLITPAVYIASIVFMVASAASFLFGTDFFVAGIGTADLRAFYMFFPYGAILLVPSLTMNLWTVEIEEVSAVLPFTVTDAVVSKWLAPLFITTAIQTVLLVVPLSVNLFGYVDAGQVFTANIIMFLYFAASAALGELISLVCRSHITAAVVCAVILALVNSLHLIPLYAALPKPLSEAANALSFAWHFDAASKGILDTRDVAFYGVLCALFVVLCVFIGERRKSR